MRTDADGLLILNAGALGDCVLALSVANALADRRPGIAVDMAARSGIVRWAKKHGVLREVVAFETLGGHGLYHERAELPEETRRHFGRYERIVSFLGGPDQPVSRNLSRWYGSAVIPVDPVPSRETIGAGRHITDQWTDELRRHGMDIGHVSADRLVTSPADRASARTRLARTVSIVSDRPITLCHPGSGGTRKCLSLEILERLVSSMHEDQERSVAWMIGPDEAERFGPGLARRLGASAPVVFEEDVSIAADLVCGCDAYIGYDAGMTHVASLAGIPTVAIYGPTDPRVWRPLGPHCTIMPFPDNEAAAGHWVDRVLAKMPAQARMAGAATVGLNPRPGSIAAPSFRGPAHSRG